MFASIRIKEMLARVSPSFDSNFASRLRRLVGVFTHRRLPLSFYPIGTLASSDSKIEKKITERLLRRRVRHRLERRPGFGGVPNRDPGQENRKRWWSPAHLRGAPFVLRAIQNRGGVRMFPLRFSIFYESQKRSLLCWSSSSEGDDISNKKIVFLIRLFASKKKES